MTRAGWNSKWGWGIGFVFLCLVIGVGCGKKESQRAGAAKPDELTVIFSSDLLGKIRSCGCMEKDMGGLGKRATYTENTRASVENCIVVDAGDLFGAGLDFSETEGQLAFDALNLMGVNAFTPGETDFVFGVPFLKEREARSLFPFVAANVVDPSTDSLLFGKALAVQRLKGGLRVGITGVLDDAIRFPAYINTSMFKVLPPVETLKKLVPEMRREADFLVLLSHMGLERSIDLARQVPEFDIIVIGHGKPIVKQLEKEGKTMLLATGGDGQYVGRIDLSLAGSGAVTWGQLRTVPMEDPLEIHPGVKALFAKYGLTLTDKEEKHKE